MSELAGKLFGLYALYRALTGRPLKGRRRPPYVIVTLTFDPGPAMRALNEARNEALLRLQLMQDSVVLGTPRGIPPAVTAAEIRANTVTASNIAANTITTRKISG